MATLNDSDDDDDDGDDGDSVGSQREREGRNITPPSQKKNVHFSNSTDVDNSKLKMRQGAVLFDPSSARDLSPLPGTFLSSSLIFIFYHLFSLSVLVFQHVI